MKIRSIILAIILVLTASQSWAQLTRSQEFHDKYNLKEVVVFSRHNIRAPMAAPGSLISKITPYEWHDFGVNAKELTMKGGILETTNGQFFQKWLVSEGLFAENDEPTDDELHVIANSKQRTISTARHFIASFMPMKNVTVNHEGKINDSDPMFTLNLGYDISDSEWAQIKAEYDAIYSDEEIRKASEALQPNFDLLSDILDITNSEAYKDGSFTGFNDHNSTIVYEAGAEPAMTASINDACMAVDALILQYYEEPDLQKAIFGKELTEEQWHMLANIIRVRDEIRFSSPFVQHYVTNKVRQYIADVLQNDERKFTFLCGHDTNILNILSTLGTKDYNIPDAIEVGTPIGTKIVFEKWTDASGNAFIAVNHVYQKVDQLRNNTLLNLTTPPNIIPLQFEGLEENEDGLIPMDKMIERLTSSVPTAIHNSPVSKHTEKNARQYTLSGLPATAEYHGIVVANGEKVVK